MFKVVAGAAATKLGQYGYGRPGGQYGFTPARKDAASQTWRPAGRTPPGGAEDSQPGRVEDDASREREKATTGRGGTRGFCSICDGCAAVVWRALVGYA